MTNVEFNGFKVLKAEPSVVFEPIGEDQLGLLGLLDQKLSFLSQGVKTASAQFGSWLDEVKSLASTIMFHGGEIMSEGSEPLTLLVIANASDTAMPLWSTRTHLKMGFLDVHVKSWDGLSRNALDGSEYGAVMRSYLSSELLILGNPAFGIKQWGACRAGAMTLFEQHPLEDLSELIANDVKAKVFSDPLNFDEIQFTGRCKRSVKSIEDSEFVAIANRAMGRRRVASAIQRNVLERTKRALAPQAKV